MEGDTVEVQNGLTSEPAKHAKKRRHRPATKAARNELRIILENAILGAESHLLTHFSVRPDGTLGAPLSLVLELLKLDQSPKFISLSNFALRSISNATRIFNIVEENGVLWVLVEPSVCNNAEDRTVYVDNLPSQCTRTRLERRAAIFGTVVSVTLPQIKRITRRLSQGLSQEPLNSGFGFIQFASKTAARRFCKRYAANSRLKHGHKRHGHKKKQPMNQMKGTQDDTALTNEAEVGPSVTKVHVMANGGEMLTSTTEVAQTHLNIEFQTPPPVLYNQQIASRQHSVTESAGMSVDESGNETDNMVMDSTVGKSEGKELMSKKKRRIRRKNRPDKVPVSPSANNEKLNLTNMLKRIQVFPLRQYKELRTEYLKLKKERMVAMKQQLKESRVMESGLNHHSNSVNLRQNDQQNDQVEVNLRQNGQQNDQVKHRRRRGRQRLMIRAERTKLWMAEQADR